MVMVFIYSIVIYLYLTIMLRIFGKKEFSQLNVFDFVVFLVISEVMTMSLEGGKINIYHSILSTATLMLLDRLESIITIRSKTLRDFFEGTPCHLIINGKVQYQRMEKLKYTIDDLCAHLRENNVDSLSKVEHAILEKNGTLSVIQKDDCDVILPDTLISDGTINQDALKLINKDEKWLFNELAKLGYYNYDNIFYCVLEKKGLYIIKK